MTTKVSKNTQSKNKTKSTRKPEIKKKYEKAMAYQDQTDRNMG